MTPQAHRIALSAHETLKGQRMKALPRGLVTALAVGAAALMLLAPVAGAGGSTTGAAGSAAGAAANGMMGGGGWCGGGMWNGAGAWGGTGMWGTGADAQWLFDDPAALQAWLEMRTAHQQAMQTW